MSLLKLLRFWVSDQKLRVTFVYNVTAYSSDTHFRAFSRTVDELSEESARGMLEVAQVDLDQQVYVARVHHLRQRVIEPSMCLLLVGLLVEYVRLEFQILTGVVAQCSRLIRQRESVDEGISG